MNDIIGENVTKYILNYYFSDDDVAFFNNTLGFDARVKYLCDNNNVSQVIYEVKNNETYQQLLTASIECKTIELMKYAITNEAKCDFQTYVNVVTFGDIKMLEHLMVHDLDFKSNMVEPVGEINLCARAAIDGKLDMLKFFYHNGIPIDYSTACCAGSESQLHILRWLKNMHFGFHESVCRDSCHNPITKSFLHNGINPGPCGEIINCVEWG